MSPSSGRVVRCGCDRISHPGSDGWSSGPSRLPQPSAALAEWQQRWSAITSESLAALAAHGIATQLASIAFMVPMGIGQAGTVRVGHAYGAGDREGIARAGATALMLAGLWLGFAVAPTDFQQGEGYRIIFVHVPASQISMFIYLVMAFWAAIGLAFNTRLSGMMAQALAPTGVAVTSLAQGVPIGGELDYLDDGTIGAALRARKRF
mgnify:CR=1 FL=1